MRIQFDSSVAQARAGQPVPQPAGNAASVTFVSPLSSPLPSPMLPPQRVVPEPLAQWIASGGAAETGVRTIAVNILLGGRGGLEEHPNLSRMSFTSLPPFPDGTREIDARNSNLRALPTSLPSTLSLLNATNTRIDHVPEQLRNLPYPARINLTGNFIPPHEVEDIRAQMAAPGYHGPEFVLDGQRTYDLDARKAAGLPAIGTQAGSLN